MNDMTIEQVRDELRRLASDGGFGQMADVIDAHLAKAAQPVEAVDIGVGRDIVKRLRDTPNWLKEAWGDFKSAGANKYDRAPKEAADYIETLLSALAHPRPTGDAIAEVAIVGWAWLLVDERTGRDYDRGFSWGEAKPDIPARAGTHYDYRALIGREKAIAASGDCNAFIHSDRGLLHDLGAHVVVDVVDVEQQAAPLVQEVPVRGARLSGDEGLTASTGEQAGEVVAWLYSWHEPLHEAERTVVADACESRARQHADQHGATLIPLYAQPRPVGVPWGYRLVPVEPTDDMCRNAREKIGIGSNVAHHVWHWMIAAAPDGEVG